MSDLILVPVNGSSASCSLLYNLLAERTAEQSISHREMPTYQAHCAFVRSDQYLAWYWIEVDMQPVGTVYLTELREIGISIFKVHQGNSYGADAVKLLMERHPGKFLANIAPGNQKSIDLFAKLGFSHIQNTYAHE